MLTPPQTEQAIILAAGTGTRLAPHTLRVPKVLVPIGGEPLLVRQLRQLAECGVEDVTVVTGDRAEQVVDVARANAAGMGLKFVHNSDFATTNNSYSLAFARTALEQGTLLLEGDVVADTSVIRALIASRGSRWLVRPFLPGMDGAVLRCGPEGALSQLTIVRRGTEVAPGAFKSMGLLRIEPDYGARLVAWLAEEIRTSGGRRYYDLVVADHLAEAAPKLLVVEEGFWAEVDTPDDLAMAERAMATTAG